MLKILGLLFFVVTVVFQSSTGFGVTISQARKAALYVIEKSQMTGGWVDEVRQYAESGAIVPGEDHICKTAMGYVRGGHPPVYLCLGILHFKIGAAQTLIHEILHVLAEPGRTHHCFVDAKAFMIFRSADLFYPNMSTYYGCTYDQTLKDYQDEKRQSADFKKFLATGVYPGFENI